LENTSSFGKVQLSAEGFHDRAISLVGQGKSENGSLIEAKDIFGEVIHDL